MSTSYLHLHQTSDEELKVLKGVKMIDVDTKSQLPVHVVLGAGEYARIKTEHKPHVGRDGEPIAELIKLGWFVMSPGEEFNREQMLLTQTSQTDYEGHCRLETLGLADGTEHDQKTVHGELKSNWLGVKKAGTKLACLGEETDPICQTTNKAACEDSKPLLESCKETEWQQSMMT